MSRVDTVTGYRQWSQGYDEPGNPASDVDEPVITDVLDRLAAGDALDAACGTGRIPRLLADHGYRVLGVDSSPEMLARARARVPEGTFQPGDLTALPVPAVRAAVSAGLRPLRCEEPVLEQRIASAETPPDPAVVAEVVHHPSVWPWSPNVLVPQAPRAADADVPAGLIWHFQLLNQCAGDDASGGRST